MAKHQARTGAFVTSYPCKDGRHDECAPYLAATATLAGLTESPIVCHCSCHPPCNRPACVEARAKNRPTK